MKRLIRKENDKVYEIKPAEGLTIEKVNDMIPEAEIYEGPWPEDTQRFKWEDGQVVSDDEEDIKEKKEEKRQKALEDFHKEKKEDVVFQGNTYEGGVESSQEVDSLIKLAKEDNEPLVTLYTKDEQGIEMSFEDAEKLSIKILRKFKKAREKRQREINKEVSKGKNRNGRLLKDK